jgi:hypothetical protein
MAKPGDDATPGNDDGPVATGQTSPARGKCMRLVEGAGPANRAGARIPRQRVQATNLLGH